MNKIIIKSYSGETFGQTLDKEELKICSLYSAKESKKFSERRSTLKAIIKILFPENTNSIIGGFHEKPRIPYCNIFVNSSRTENLYAHFISDECEVGLDIEKINGIKNSKQLAEGFMSKEEIQTFKKLTPSKEKIAFYSCWTRKEAFLKTTGSGFSINPSLLTLGFSLQSHESQVFEKNQQKYYINQFILNDLIINACLTRSPKEKIQIINLDDQNTLKYLTKL